MRNDSRYRTILLFGPPGAGKGTQGKILGSIPGFLHVASGDVFRSLDPTSELGKIFTDYSSRGALVPDDLTVKMWEEHMQNLTEEGTYRPDSALLILDGIPRNLNQARLMDEHIQVLSLIHLGCEDEDAMVDRLSRRALKENRADDAREEVIRHRLKVYEQETQPVIEYYSASLVNVVDALGTPAEVLQQVLKLVAPVQRCCFPDGVET